MLSEMRLIFVVVLLFGCAFAHIPKASKGCLESNSPLISSISPKSMVKDVQPVQKQPVLSLQAGIDILNTWLSNGKLLTSVWTNPSNLASALAKIVTGSSSTASAASNQKETTVAFQLEEVEPTPDVKSAPAIKPIPEVKPVLDAKPNPDVKPIPDIKPVNEESWSLGPHFIGKPLGLHALPSLKPSALHLKNIIEDTIPMPELTENPLVRVELDAANVENKAISSAASKAQSSISSSIKEQSSAVSKGKSLILQDIDDQPGADELAAPPLADESNDEIAPPAEPPMLPTKGIFSPFTEVTNNNVIIRPVSVSGTSTIINPVVNVGNKETLKVAGPAMKEVSGKNSPTSLSVNMDKPISISAIAGKEKHIEAEEEKEPKMDKKSLILSRMALPETPKEEVKPSVGKVEKPSPVVKAVGDNPPTIELPLVTSLKALQGGNMLNIDKPPTVDMPKLKDVSDADHLSHIELGENETIIGHDDVENVPKEILKHIDLSKL